MTCKYFLPFCGQPFDSVYRQWHPTPVLLPGKSHGQRSLMGCCPWSLLQWVARSRTRLSDFTFTFRFHALEKEMATHSRVLAWRVPGTAEPGGLLSLGLHRVGHDWSDLAAAAASDQIRSVAQSCPTLCNPMNRSTPGLPVHHQLLEFRLTSIESVMPSIQDDSHPLSSPSPPAPNPSQHQSLFQWVNSSHEVAKVLEFQL